MVRLSVKAFATKLRQGVFIRFVTIGLTATALHGAVLHTLVVQAGLHPTLANVFAFSTAFVFSYFGHYFVSFRSRERHVKSAPRFLTIAVGGLALNSAIFGVVVNWLGLHYWIAFALVVTMTPTVVFFASKRFAFSAG